MALVAKLLRLASRAACLIVIVSFAIFAVEQTDKASGHQQNALKGTGRGASEPQVETKTNTGAKEGSVHRTIDEAAEALTSPFSGLTSGSSQWAVRGVGTLMALLIYGVAVGYVARMMRIRV